MNIFTPGQVQSPRSKVVFPTKVGGDRTSSSGWGLRETPEFVNQKSCSFVACCGILGVRIINQHENI